MSFGQSIDLRPTPHSVLCPIVLSVYSVQILKGLRQKLTHHYGQSFGTRYIRLIFFYTLIMMFLPDGTEIVLCRSSVQPSIDDSVIGYGVSTEMDE